MSGVDSTIQAILPAVVEIRRELHRHPELGLEEHATSRRVQEALAGIGGIEVQAPMAGTGVVAVLNRGKPGPCVALRADMDGLPIQEQTGLGYASECPGRMHACGHDGHMACLLGTAMVLSRLAGDLAGPVKFIFQPGEESQAGGRAMCEAGALEKPRVDAAFALHSWPTTSLGSIATRPGSMLAGSDTFTITVTGQGAHGAYPHRGIDPLVVASHIVIALQTIVARRVNPLESAVVSVGTFHGGTAANVIPPDCRIEGTLRFCDAQTRDMLRASVSRIAESTAAAFGATARTDIDDGYPMLVNDPGLTEWLIGVGCEVLGQQRVDGETPLSMGVEDFSYYAQRVPSAMFLLGLRPEGAESYPALHNPMFDFNDEALGTGIRVFCELAMRFGGEARMTNGSLLAGQTHMD